MASIQASSDYQAFRDRGTGILVGLAAGDRNGGPIQMALVLAETLEKSTPVYNPVDVFQGYSDWHANGTGIDAWDTGPIAQKLLHQFKVQSSSKTKSYAEHLEILENRSLVLDQQLKGLTAGVNAVHRVAPLVLAPFLSDEEELIDAARQESRLTHWSLISQNTCAIFVVIVRHLLFGKTILEAVDYIIKNENILSSETPIIISKLQEGLKSTIEYNSITQGGFCPEVLKASIYFIIHSNSFNEAMENSISFAGPCNYCPVLVGVLAGAIYGSSNISEDELHHCKLGIKARCIRSANKLLIGFNK